MTIHQNLSGGDIVKRLLTQMGLLVPVSVSQATDATSKQLWALLTQGGQELLDEPGGWQFFQKTYTVNTTPGQLVYPLPDDFERWIPQTGWNVTSRIPLGGPLTPQQWEILQVRQLGGTTLQLQYIIAQGQLQFYKLPDTSVELQIGYYGRGWVQDATDPTIFKDTVEDDADIVMFDTLLMLAKLKLLWRIAKGFDTSAAAADYAGALARAKSKEPPGQDLRLDKRGNGIPYVGYLNMPETNYGG